MITKTLAEVNFGFHLLEYFFGFVSPEGSVACYQLEQEDAYCPDIDFVVIGSVLNHLWGHVLVSPTKGLSFS